MRERATTTIEDCFRSLQSRPFLPNKMKDQALQCSAVQCSAANDSERGMASRSTLVSDWKQNRKNDDDNATLSMTAVPKLPATLRRSSTSFRRRCTRCLGVFIAWMFSTFMLLSSFYFQSAHLSSPRPSFKEEEEDAISFRSIKDSANNSSNFPTHAVTSSMVLRHVEQMRGNSSNHVNSNTNASANKANKRETATIPTVEDRSYLSLSSASSSYPIHWKNRNYATHPVTALESKYLTSATHAQYKNLTLAVCHPTMFGDETKLSLHPFFAFVSYYRLLGFDHVFLWYRSNLRNMSRFDEFINLPYVTATEYIDPPESQNKNGTTTTTASTANDASSAPEYYHGQYTVEQTCMSDSRFAAKYDWAFAIDADEYLWLDTRQNIKDFVLPLDRQGYSYLSFGKDMYTTMHVYKPLSSLQNHDDDDDAGFGLDQYPFTPGSHCQVWSPGSHYCPGWAGRAKVLVKPSVHPHGVKIHGYDKFHMKPGGKHFNTKHAHLKEFVGRLFPHPQPSVHYRNNDTTSVQSSSFFVTHQTQIETHRVMTSHKKNKAGQVTVHLDDELHDWLLFVAQGCPSS